MSQFQSPFGSFLSGQSPYPGGPNFPTYSGGVKGPYGSLAPPQQGFLGSQLPFQGTSGGFFGGSQALGNLLGAANKRTFGGNIFQALMEDYQKTGQALGANFGRGLGVEQQLQEFAQGLQGMGEQFGQGFEQLAEDVSGQVTDVATKNLADIQDYIDTQYGEAKGYFDTGLSRFEEGIEEYGRNQAALWSSQALAAQQGFQNAMTQIASDPGMTPEMKAAQSAQLKLQTMQQTQAMIAPQQARLEEVRLGAKQALGAMYQQAGAALGQLGVSYGGLLQAGQGALQQASQFVAGLKTQAKLQAQQLNLQGFQLQLAGLNSLAQAVKSNPLMFASAGPVALAAANLSRMGLSPFGGGGAGQYRGPQPMGFRAFQQGGGSPFGGPRLASSYPQYPTWFLPGSLRERLYF